MADTVRTKTHVCPRCGESHLADASPFARGGVNVRLPWGVELMTHWYLCPETGEPVLLRFGEPPLVSGNGGMN